MRQFSQNIQKSVHRCKKWIISVFITYCLSSLIGIMMVNSGNHLALSTRDKIIGHAMHKDRALIHYIHGNHYSAILLDFSENLFIGSLTQTVVGLSIVIPYITNVMEKPVLQLQLIEEGDLTNGWQRYTGHLCTQGK